jgi:hypothetical protein
VAWDSAYGLGLQIYNQAGPHLRSRRLNARLRGLSRVHRGGRRGNRRSPVASTPGAGDRVTVLVDCPSRRISEDSWPLMSKRVGRWCRRW